MSKSTTKVDIKFLMGHPIGRIMLRIALIPGRLQFLWVNRKRAKTMDSVTRSLVDRIGDARRANSKNFEYIYNIGLFVALFDRDLTTYSRMLYFANTTWDQQFAARGLAVLLYEGIEDLPELLGKGLRSRMKDLGLGEEWFDSLNSISAKVNSFKSEHRQELLTIRLLVGAHREHDAIEQVAILDSIDALEIWRLSGNFSVPLREFVEMQTRLMHLLNDPGVVLREAARLVESGAYQPKD